MATGSDAIIDDDSVKRRSNNFFKEGVGQAIFWPSSEGSIGMRQLQGELEIKQGLKPSFVFPRLSIRVSEMAVISFSVLKRHDSTHWTSSRLKHPVLYLLLEIKSISTPNE